MSTGQWDDPEYPYLPRYHPPVASAVRWSARRPFPWKTVARWLVRGVVTATVMTIVTAFVLGLVLYRAGSRAWTLSDFEQRGAQVTYWHEYPTNQDTLSQAWRDRLGDCWWSEPREIVYTGNGYWQGPWGFHWESAADVQEFCLTCGSFQRVQKFTIASDHFTCDQIARWPHLAQLEELDVESHLLTDSDLVVIGRMSSLKKLRIAKATLTTAALDRLARLPALESLTLDQIDISGPPEQPASGFAKLTSLAVYQSPRFDDDALLCLGPLPALEVVHVNQTPIGDVGLSHFLKSGTVGNIIVAEGNRLTDACFRILAEHDAPQSLVLSGESLTDSGLAALEGRRFPTLVFEATALTDAAFGSLAKVSGLDHLTIHNSKITGSGLKSWPVERRLEHLDLSGNPLTPEGVKLLAELNCASLALDRTNFDDQQLLLFTERDDLTQLNVTETNVTPGGVKAFYEARKRRHQATGKAESLTLICDYPEIAQHYYSGWGSTASPAWDEEVPIELP